MELYLIALTIIFNYKVSKLNILINTLSKNEIVDLFNGDLISINMKHNIITEDMFNKLNNQVKLQGALNKAKSIIEISNKEGIRIVTIYDEVYPEKLKSIKNFPIVLYVKGDIQLLKEHEKSIACIGTRDITSYGIYMINSLIPIFVREKFIIISGLALGVDSAAHKECIENKGKTIAVLACGLDGVYPKSNNKLANQILDTGGLIISEYPVGENAIKHRFVDRNRIVSGLSDGVLLIECKEKSGSMHTINFAISQSKFIMYPRITNYDIENTGVKSLKEKKIGMEIREDVDCYKAISKLGYSIENKKQLEIYKIIRNSFKSLSIKNINGAEEMINKKKNDPIDKEFKNLVNKLDISEDEILYVLKQLIIYGNKTL